MSQKKPVNFKKLQQDWYKKLKDSGFEDIERPNGLLKMWSSEYERFISIYDRTTWIAKAQYFQLAENFFHDYKFETEKDKLIWGWHKENISIRNIVKKLKLQEISTNRDAVHKTIIKLKKSMFTLYLVDHQEYYE